MRLGESGGNRNIEAISTGSLALDVALGVGGLPKGRIVEIFGAEAAGKSTLAISTVAQAQKQGGTCAYVDVEHALDPIYAEIIGVNVDDLLISQPDSAEAALEVVDQLVRTASLDVIVLDSVAALVPASELDGEMGKTQIGVQARLMSQALRKLTGVVSKTNTVCIFINQLREKIGVVFGSPETTPGGRALKYYSSVRIDMRRRETLKDGDRPIGAKVRMRVVKNKVAPPFRFAEMEIMFGTGIDADGDVVDLATEHGVIERKGAYYYLNGDRMGQGREQAKGYLKEHPEVRDRLSGLVRDAAMPRRTG